MPAPKRKNSAAPQRHGDRITTDNSAFANARQLAEKADYDAALAILEDCPGPEADLLRAHCHTRLRHYDLAISALQWSRTNENPLRQRAEMLYVSLRDRMLVAKSSNRKSVPLPKFPRSKDPAVQVELDYYEALSYWIRDNLEAARKLNKSAMKSDDPIFRAWGLNLDGWIEVKRGRLSIASRRFCEVLDVLEASTSKDELMRINSLHGLAGTAVETLARSYFARIFRESSFFENSSSTARLRVQILSYVGIAKLLEGKPLDALKALLSARGVDAPSPFSALPNVQLAGFNRALSCRPAAQLYLDMAGEAFSGSPSGFSDVEARIVGALYVIEYTELTGKVPSGVTFDLFNFSEPRDPMLVLDDTPISQAFCLYAEGAMEACRHERAAAITHIEQARSLFLEQQYFLRAAQATVSLLSLDSSTNGEPIEVMLQSFPGSTIAADFALKRSRSINPFNNLSAAERRVTEAICEGLTSKQIAAKLGRSPATVRVQTANIFKKVAVKTRTALVALVREADADGR